MAAEARSFLHRQVRNMVGTLKLVGSWRLVSFQTHVVGEGAPPREFFGARPFGRLILTPAHTMAAFVSKPDRKPPASKAEAAALLSSMIAYTGKFRLEGEKLITTADGNTLSIRIAEMPGVTLPGKRTVSMLAWEPEE